MARRTYIALALVVAALALGATALAVAITNDPGNCHEQTVAEAKATNGNDSLRVVHPPDGSTVIGGGQRIDVDGHVATLHGPGKMQVVCK